MKLFNDYHLSMVGMVLLLLVAGSVKGPVEPVVSHGNRSPVPMQKAKPKSGEQSKPKSEKGFLGKIKDKVEGWANDLRGKAKENKKPFDYVGFDEEAVRVFPKPGDKPLGTTAEHVFDLEALLKGMPADQVGNYIGDQATMRNTLLNILGEGDVFNYAVGEPYRLTTALKQKQKKIDGLEVLKSKESDKERTDSYGRQIKALGEEMKALKSESEGLAGLIQNIVETGSDGEDLGKLIAALEAKQKKESVGDASQKAGGAEVKPARKPPVRVSASNAKQDPAVFTDINNIPKS